MVFWTLMLTTFLGNFYFSQSLLFKRTSASTSILSDALFFEASSRIECTLVCFFKTAHHSCTSFAFNKSAGLCTCGRRRRLLPAEDTSPGELLLHTSTDCSISKTGEFQFLDDSPVDLIGPSVPPIA